MGYQTEFMVLNDAASEIRQYPVEFAERIYEACTGNLFYEKKRKRNLEYVPDRVTIPLGNHCNPITALRPHHADERRIIISHCNAFEAISPWSYSYREIVKNNPEALDADIRALKQELSELERLKRELKRMDT